MAVRIGHAVASENGTVDGKNGNQTGKELRIGTWYKNGWNYVLRPKTKELAEKSALAASIACFTALRNAKASDAP